MATIEALRPAAERSVRLIDETDRRIRRNAIIAMAELDGGNMPFHALAITAIHNTDLGKNNLYGRSLGGARIKKIDFRNEIAIDAVTQEADELARDMSRKWITLYGMLKEMQQREEAYPWEARAAMMDGGKTIIAVPAYVEDAELILYRRELLGEFARHIENLGGAHITAEDMGTNPEDMDIIFESTRYVSCRTEKNGGTGNPSPTTAVGVWSGAKALMRKRNINASKATYGIQGVGNVGGELVSEILHDHPKATIFVSDIDKEKINAIKALHPHVKVVKPEDFWSTGADVIMPCAGSYILNFDSLDRMQQTGSAKIVCGSANDQYPVVDGEPDPEIVRAFYKAGIIVAPAPLVNLGGILHLSSEWWRKYGLSDDVDHHQRSRKLVQGIGPLIAELFDKSQGQQKPLEEVYLSWVVDVYADYLANSSGETLKLDTQEEKSGQRKTAGEILPVDNPERFQIPPGQLAKFAQQNGSSLDDPEINTRLRDEIKQAKPVRSREILVKKRVPKDPVFTFEREYPDGSVRRFHVAQKGKMFRLVGTSKKDKKDPRFKY